MIIKWATWMAKTILSSATAYLIWAWAQRALLNLFDMHTGYDEDNDDCLEHNIGWLFVQ